MFQKESNYSVLNKFLKNSLAIFTALVKYIYFSFFKKNYFNNHHLEITLKDSFHLSVKWYSHDEYIVYKKKLLKLIRKETSDPLEVIEYALNECSHCNFIIFSCENEDEFIQFWLGDKKLMADWPIIKENTNFKKHTYEMLGVLNSLDIHRVNLITTKKPKRLPYYVHNIDNKLETYSIYFQKYPQDAVKFTEIMLRDIFKENLENLNIKIG
ncbi:MAG: hypothetical protein HN981_04410 [Candidatus Pacebacteria bacterium]|jgi:hypothetical protein|nr:hypothetical protein [Candidatus Paceibacterota bacterium]MBT4652489.1 hypothetical protein [Candidatus Paceibacterota bacterium]MBT6756316.1 hypothetical protein [Candidatus Paceibacterota bacterium]MBT6921607.1 hypothetical protein [Candidatus Paceibacterota bacterium]